MCFPGTRCNLKRRIHEPTYKWRPRFRAAVRRRLVERQQRVVLCLLHRGRPTMFVALSPGVPDGHEASSIHIARGPFACPIRNPKAADGGSTRMDLRSGNLELSPEHSYSTDSVSAKICLAKVRKVYCLSIQRVKIQQPDS